MAKPYTSISLGLLCAQLTILQDLRKALAEMVDCVVCSPAARLVTCVLRQSFASYDQRMLQGIYVKSGRDAKAARHSLRSPTTWTIGKQHTLVVVDVVFRTIGRGTEFLIRTSLPQASFNPGYAPMISLPTSNACNWAAGTRQSDPQV